MELRKSKVVNKQIFSDGYYLLQVENVFAPSVIPGQFFEVKVGKTYDPFLLRPFSVFYVDGDSIFFLIRIVGRGTSILSEVNKGEVLEILGPLGRGFPVLENVVLVAGGSGIAPLYFYAKTFGFKKFLWGLKSLPSKEFLGLFEGTEITIVTEDGSSGFRGLVTDFVEHEREAHYFACGPIGMIKALRGKVDKNKCFVSLESVMGCGVGLCFGCALKRHASPGYFRVCKDGPVFNLQEIDI